MKRHLFAVVFATAVSLGSTAAEFSAAHRQRADKIVAGLSLDDAAKAQRVAALVAAQYHGVNVIHDGVKADIKRLKEQSPAPAAKDLAAASQALRDAAAPKLAALHTTFLANLAAELTPAQIDQIKNGMTFGVLPLTFRVYQEMVPNLTAEQKAKIYAWLVEAREHAMDAGSAEEKHAWFGKYKGRINNYLAAAGIDLKQAERDMHARQKAAAKSAGK